MAVSITLAALVGRLGYVVRSAVRLTPRGLHDGLQQWERTR